MRVRPWAFLPFLLLDAAGDGDGGRGDGGGSGADAGEQHTEPKTAPARGAGDGDATLKALRSALETEREKAQRLEGELAEARDKLGKAKNERAKFEEEVTKLTNGRREDAILGQLYRKLPGASEVEVRGVFRDLAERKLVERFAEDPEAAAKQALEKMETEAPGLFRKPVSGGGKPPDVAKKSGRPRFGGL